MAACAPVDVPLVTLPDAGVLCSTDANCLAEDSFCDRSDTGCTAQVGFCKKKPVLLCEQFSPVCGCDGVSYSSACWAGVRGVSIAQQHECDDLGTRCDPGHPCPADAVCARITRTCQSHVEGLCFDAPPTCALAPHKAHGCPPDDRCLDACAAIHSGLVFSFDATCP